MKATMKLMKNHFIDAIGCVWEHDTYTDRYYYWESETVRRRISKKTYLERRAEIEVALQKRKELWGF